MDYVYFKSINGIRDKDLNAALSDVGPSLTVALDDVVLESTGRIDIITSDPANFTQADRDLIISTVEAIDNGAGAISFENYVRDKKQEIDDKTAELIAQGRTYLGKHYRLDLITQHNVDALGGNFSDNVIERMNTEGESLATAYATVQLGTYPARVSTSDGGYTSFTTHTAYMAFKNDLLGRIKVVSYGGQDKRAEVDAVTYGDFDGVDAVNDDRT